jgi:aspartate/methionine/tyrosine aminotransferase
MFKLNMVFEGHTGTCESSSEMCVSSELDDFATDHDIAVIADITYSYLYEDDFVLVNLETDVSYKEKNDAS